MAIKCLTSEEKKDIAELYNNKTMIHKELAQAYLVSERTINRVLIEAGLATPVERKNGEAHQVMLLMKKYGFDIKALEELMKANRTESMQEVVDEYLMSLSDRERIVLFNDIHKRSEAKKNEFNDPRFPIAA